MRRTVWYYFGTLLAAVAALVIVPVAAQALDVPTVPKDVPIVDQTNTLTDEQKIELASIISAEQLHSGNQIGILMIPSLNGDSLEDYSLRVARTWGIGSKERDNGVLLLVVKNDHRIRIEVGRGLEGALPDIRAGQIIRDRMAPLLRQEKYFEGIQSGLQGITAAIHYEVDPALQPNAPQANPHFSWEFILFLLLIIPGWIASMLARTKSWWAGGVLGAIAGFVVISLVGSLLVGVLSLVILIAIGLLFDRAVSANYQKRASQGMAPSWWAGGPYIGGGRNSGGGFGGFGGGGFGGGGASGSW